MVALIVRTETEFNHYAKDGEERMILKMLTKAEGYAKRYSPVDLLEDVRSFLPLDVTNAVRAYLSEESNSVSLESFIAICVRNRVTKVSKLKYNQYRVRGEITHEPSVWMRDQVGIEEVLDRLSPVCRALAEFAINREVPLDLYLDSFAVAFELDIPVDEVSAIFEELRKEIEHGG